MHPHANVNGETLENIVSDFFLSLSHTHDAPGTSLARRETYSSQCCSMRGGTSRTGVASLNYRDFRQELQAASCPHSLPENVCGKYPQKLRMATHSHENALPCP